MPIFPATFDLSSLDGSNGFVINGITSNSRTGFAVSSAGDINNDGTDDFIVGAYRATPNGNSQAGESYVVFGSDTSSISSLDLSALNGNNGFVINGIDSNDFSGVAVSGTGDVNGDGIDDLIVGAYKADPNGTTEAGESYVVFGGNTPAGNSFNLSSINGSNGFVINGAGNFDRSGFAVSGAGDVNGDGISDLIVGARDADPNGKTSAGASYVVYGSAAIGGSLDLSALDGTNGFAINGVDAGDRSGFAVSSAGDVNNDGFDDVIVGAQQADPNGETNAGESYVIFGSNTATISELNLSDLNGSNGFVVNGVNTDDVSGFSVASAGDVNNDGIDDLIIGAQKADIDGNSSAGETYIVYGGAGIAAGGSIDLSNLNGSNGFIINGIDKDDFSGVSVSGAGDVNGDGIDDVIIGAYAADPDGRGAAGESYVVFGQTTTVGSVDLSSLDGINGFVVNGVNNFDRSGRSVSGAGDINGDGVADLLIGAYGASSSAGKSYIIYGQTNQPTSNDDIIDGIPNVDNTIDALAGNDVIRSANGNDTLIGNLGNDRLYGNDGNDELFGNEGTDKLYGNNGIDILHGGANNDILDGGAGNDTLNGETGNDTLLGFSDNDTLNGGGGSDRLIGHEGDDTLNGGDDSDTLYGNDGIDTLNGDGGNDLLRGGAGADLLNGGQNNDTLYGDDDNDTLSGNEGEDFLHGGSGNDTLNGGDESDRLYGALGDDILNGDAGNDTLRGNDGNDTLNGGADDDVLVGGNGEDILNGDAGNDTLHGYADNDTLNGGEGDDRLFGNGGDDILAGGAGSDRIYGGSGNDIITGSLPGSTDTAQIDILYGQGGNDTYVIEQMYVGGGVNDHAIIRGFSKTADTIQLSSGVTYTLGAVASGTGIYNDGDLVTVLESHVLGAVDLEGSYFSFV